jgi:hypothetical protein
MLCCYVAPGLQTPAAAFERFIEAHAPHNVFVATDNKETQARFVALCGPRAKGTTPIHAKRALRQTKLWQAVADLFVCAAAEVFKGSFYSSFSDAAAHLRAAHGRTHGADEHEVAG